MSKNCPKPGWTQMWDGFGLGVGMAPFLRTQLIVHPRHEFVEIDGFNDVTQAADLSMVRGDLVLSRCRSHEEDRDGFGG
jgi:hypothetical protein